MLKMNFYKHLDWLCRIAIPKDIREHIELQEKKNKVEIYLNENNEIIIKKVDENE